MGKLWKATSVTGMVLGILCLAVMMIYSVTKSVVITEQHDLEGEGNLKPLMENILAQKKKYDFIVLVNAAHGGDNKGNVVNDLQEKKITLDVGKELDKMDREREIGIFLIREEDIDISNENRAELIEEVKPDLVIDLHVNADAVNERTQGTSVVYNDCFYRPGMTNAQVADIMERSLVTEIEGKALGIFGDSQNKYPLLKMIRVPAISVEMGYLTNKQEADLLKKEKYQERIAVGIFEGIKKIREEIKASSGYETEW